MDRQEYDTQQATHAWLTARDAGTTREARQWLERAYRFAYTDDAVAFALASTRLADGDPAAARRLFAAIAERRPTRDVLAGLVASTLADGDRAAAARTLARLLSAHAPSPTVLALARSCGAAPGWCALQDDGTLIAETGGRIAVTLDGAVVAAGTERRLPPSWRTAATLTVALDGQPLLGSPIDLIARRRTEGFVALTDQGIEGWAWQPAAPDTDPVLQVMRGRRRTTLRASAPAAISQQAIPLARPRGFTHACDTSRPLRVVGRDGRDLWGSPLGGPAHIAPAPAPHAGTATAIVIPVYRDAAATRACIASVRATIAPGDRIIVVNDASPEADLVAELQALADLGIIALLPSCAHDPARNLGFPAAANAGLIAAGGCDVVLLNSDTVVFPGWLAALREAAHSAADIGTATPISNDATIFSYPAAAAAMPTPAEGARLARLAARVNRGILVDVPTGHGFCLFIRADCLHRTGLLRAALFAQGYGEENDFCERARAHGFRHVAVPGVYVAHQGGASFGAAKTHLLARNLAILEKLHPTYLARVDAFADADPLGPSRRRLDSARLRAAYRSGPGTVLLVSHATRGGTTRVVQERIAAARARGLLPLVLRGDEGTTLVGEDGAFPNLRFDLAKGAADLPGLLRALRPVELELHHLMGHHPALLGILNRLALPTDIWVHDYGCLCPRLTLATGDGRFCGEAPVAACVPCLAQWEQAYTPPIDAATLRARSATMFAAARRVVVASADVAARIRRHFPTARIDQTAWQPDPPPAPARRGARAARTAGSATIAVIGAISQAKGYDVLLACARDAAARRLKLRFVVVGFTLDDTPLLETGHVFVTGQYQPEEAAALIASTGADIAFLPSIWPETWCYALSDAWDGGLDAVVFDIGTPAERVRRTGRGVVLPLGLPPGAVNDTLLNPQILACRSSKIQAPTARA
jgi:GT2 family glycosyltransferase/glycosyltransferase involved in cell wall biosynthesis